MTEQDPINALQDHLDTISLEIMNLAPEDLEGHYNTPAAQPFWELKRESFKALYDLGRAWFLFAKDLHQDALGLTHPARVVYDPNIDEWIEVKGDSFDEPTE